MEFPNLKQQLNAVFSQLTSAGLADVANSGSVSNLMATAFVGQTSRVANFVRRVYANSFIQNATGIYLDIHGEELGLDRQESLPAIVFADDKVLKISTPRGTLRDRMGSSIASGTEVSNEAGTIRYTLPLTGIPAGTDELYVSGVCQTPGTGGNIGAGTLTVLSIQVDDVEVTNVEPILSGRDRESDSAYRARLLSLVQGGQNVSGSSLTAVARGVPGIATAILLDNAFGINNPALLIAGPDKVRAGLINQVQAVIDPLLPFGTRVTVIAPRYRELDLTLVVDMQEGFNQPGIRNQIEAVVRELSTPHVPGTEFRLDNLDAEITRAIPNVLDVVLTEARLDGRETGTRIIQTKNTEQVIIKSIFIELV